MKNKAILVSLITLVAIVFVLNTVLASNFVTINQVKINGMVANQGTTNPAIAGDVSDTVPVEVYFTANQDETNVRAEVYFDGYRNNVDLQTDRFVIVNGSQYVKRFTVQLPSSQDISDLTDQLPLYVRMSALDADPVEQTFNVEMQRSLYNLQILSVGAPDTAVTGTVVPVDVVVQNNGYSRLDNVYVKVSIPELGVEKNLYYGDLGQNEEGSDTYYDQITDTMDKIVYLNIPTSAQPGTYNLNIEAYNYDTDTTVKKKVVVNTVQSGIIPTTSAQTIAVGDTASYNVVLVNPSDRMVVYTVAPEQSNGLSVQVEQPVVTVPASSSTTVKVDVKATNSATEGANTVTVDVSSDGTMVKQVPLTVNVEKTSSVTGAVVGTTDNSNNLVLILTVVLVIIFVVLLVVLIVLLTKKPAQTEEFGETSYY